MEIFFFFLYGGDLRDNLRVILRTESKGTVEEGRQSLFVNRASTIRYASFVVWKTLFILLFRKKKNNNDKTHKQSHPLTHDELMSVGYITTESWTFKSFINQVID